MPHLIVEWTNNLHPFNADALLLEANQRLAATGHFTEADIKSRAQPLGTFRVGTADEPRAFVHATLSLLPGRSEEVRRRLSKLLLDVLRAHAPGDFPGLQLSVEINQIHGPSYAKLTLGVGRMSDNP